MLRCSWAVREEEHKGNVHSAGSAGFSLKTQPRLLLLPTASPGSTTATVSSWVHPVLSSNLSRKFKTFLQDVFSRHPSTTTLAFMEHIEYPVTWTLLVLLTSLNFFVFTLPPTLPSSDTGMLKIQQYKRRTHGFRMFSFFWLHIWNSLPQDLRHRQLYHHLKPK